MSKQGVSMIMLYSQLVAAVKEDHDIMLPNKAGPAVAQLIVDITNLVCGEHGTPEWDGVLRTGDLSITTFSTSNSSWGANTNGVRITHTPTGTVAESGAERSQHLNRVKAMRRMEALLGITST